MAMIDAAKLREQMSQSRKAGLPEYNWIPPIWETGPTPPELPDTTPTEPTFDDPSLSCDRGVEAYPGEETPQEPTPGNEDTFKHGYTKWIHPHSDTTHTEPALWNDADLKKAREKLKDTPQLEKLKKLIGRESLGMQRLACLFEWALCKATEILNEVNEGIGKGESKSKPDRKRYNEARYRYIKFLRDLDDHEPELRQKLKPADVEALTKPGPIQPGVPGNSGYGRALKWIYVYPLIYHGVIYGAKVSIHWNPHSSSNGIPIQHA